MKDFLFWFQEGVTLRGKIPREVDGLSSPWPQEIGIRSTFCYCSSYTVAISNWEGDNSKIQRGESLCYGSGSNAQRPRHSVLRSLQSESCEGTPSKAEKRVSCEVQVLEPIRAHSGFTLRDVQWTYWIVLRTCCGTSWNIADIQGHEWRSSCTRFHTWRNSRWIHSFIASRNESSWIWKQQAAEYGFPRHAHTCIQS